MSAVLTMGAILLLVFLVQSLYVLGKRVDPDSQQIEQLHERITGQGYHLVILPPDLTLHHEWEASATYGRYVISIATGPSKQAALEQLAWKLDLWPLERAGAVA